MTLYELFQCAYWVKNQKIMILVMKQLRKAYAEIADKVIKPVSSIFLLKFLSTGIKMNEK